MKFSPKASEPLVTNSFLTLTGVVNVVSGDDKQEFNVGAYLSNHPKVKLVSFTGSVPTGKKIMGCAANDVKRVTLEMVWLMLCSSGVTELALRCTFPYEKNLGRQRCGNRSRGL